MQTSFPDDAADATGTANAPVEILLTEGASLDLTLDNVTISAGVEHMLSIPYGASVNITLNGEIRWAARAAASIYLTSMRRSSAIAVPR